VGTPCGERPRDAPRVPPSTPELKLTPDAAIAEAKKGGLRPVYLVTGPEQWFRDQVVNELRSASLGGGIAAFNEDKFTAGETDVDRVVASARTVPMMAPRRFVLVRSADRWDTATSGDGDDAKKESPLDRLMRYVSDPVDSTCMVIVAAKLDGRRRLATTAKKEGFVVQCEPLDSRKLASWIVAECNGKGHAIDREVAELLGEIAGPELGSVNDAIERLCLYSGEGAPVTEAAVAECVARVRTADTWALVNAVGARDLGGALTLLAEVYDPRDRGLPLLGALAWSIRQLARFQAGTDAGMGQDEAAKAAGIYQPFRAREIAQKVKSFRPRELERWLLVLAETDLALKSSRRPADAILDNMLTRMCKGGTARAASPPPFDG
jgi:DNA polymerase-3 subunit delta